MFDTFTRSWEITKTTFSVMKQDKEILLFPVLAAFFSLLFFAVMVVPFIMSAFAAAILDALGIPGALLDILFFPVIFILYFGLSFIATFFNVGVVYTAKKRFEGGDSKFTEAIGFCFSKIHLIFAWVLVSATVGTILRAIESIGRKAGPVGAIITNIMTSILGMVWAIITIFVVPSMVFNNTGPIAAIKDSIEVIKKTWGENLIKHFGLGLAQLLIFIALFVPFLVLAIIGFFINPLIGILVVVAFVGIVILIYMFFTAANAIFNTALFWYATKGQVPAAYTPDVMQNAFRQKSGMFSTKPAIGQPSRPAAQQPALTQPATPVQPAAPAQAVKPAPQVNQQIISWARTEWARGKAMGDITRVLLEAGYSESDVEQILGAIHG